MAFNKKEYDVEYRRKHKRQFKVDLNIDEYEELIKLLEKKGMTRVQLVRDGLKRLKEEKTR